MILFLVGKFIDDTERGRVWEFQGIFDSESAAVAACRNWRYCVQKVEVNREIPDETIEFPDSYFPIPRPVEVQ